jgi:hypothetical protein
MLNRTAVTGAVVAALACAPTLLAESAVERFSFSVANAPTTGLPGEDRLEATIHQWSSDADRDRLYAVIAENDPQTIAHTFRTTPTAGFIRWPGGLQYTLRYARRTPRPDGGADIVLVADSRVWVWWDAPFKTGIDDAFTVIQLRVDKDGKGVGKLSTPAKIRGDKASGVVAVEFDTAPAMLTDVRAQRS